MSVAADMMLARKLGRIEDKLDRIIHLLTGEKHMSQEIDAALAALTDRVAQTEGAEASAAAAIQGIAGEYAKLLTGSPDPALAGKLAALTTRLQVAGESLAAAVAANPVPNTTSAGAAPPPAAFPAPPAPTP